MKRRDITDYDEYLRLQQKRTNSKWGGKTFIRNFYKFLPLMKEVYKITGNVGSICCMGIRNGNEYFAFQGGDRSSKYHLGLDEFKDSEVYGVDLDGRVTGVGKNCFNCDFSKLPKKWENKFGMVYSNSLDHAFDVKETLKEWHRVTKKDGFIMLTLSKAPVSGADINSFELDDISLFNKKMFKVLKVWDRDNLSVLLKVKKIDGTKD